MNRALTEHELRVLARLARRPLQSLKRSIQRIKLPGAPTDGPIVGVDLHELEKRGLVERWPFGDCWLWRPTDQPPRFDRPHWQCRPMTEEEVAGFGRGGSIEGHVMTVHVEPRHPELSIYWLVSFEEIGLCHIEDVREVHLADSVRHAERKIAEAIALRSAGDAVDPGARDEASVTVHRVRKFAIVRQTLVVDRIVAIMYGATVDSAFGFAVELPDNPEHPVGRGWTFRHGTFYSPALENGLGAGQRQVRAKTYEPPPK